MKKDISTLRFQAIAGWRGDSHACPQAFGGDIYSGCSMGCWWCFCREMEAELFTKYYRGWHPGLVRPCDVDEYRRLFDRAFGSDRPSNNWTICCLRRGLPFNMGSKAETFCREDLTDNVVVPVLELFREYRVPVIFETKSHYIGLARYLDIIKELKAAVIVAVMGGTDTLNYILEPGAPPASSRWYLVRELNRRGIWTGVRWEPILSGINSREADFRSYLDQAQRSGARHVSFYNYRTSNWRMAKREFEARGFNYGRMLEGNLDENWRPVGKRFFELAREAGVPVSSPDFVNFPFDSACESCCGVDGLFTPYEFTFQHALRILRQRGHVSWDDMEEVDFREPNAYGRIRAAWNGGRDVFSLADCPEVTVVERDKNGYNIYSRKTNQPGSFQRGLIF